MMGSLRVVLLAAALLTAAPAWSAQPVAGFPRQVKGNAKGKDVILVTTPIALEASGEGQGKVWFGAGNELHCMTLAGADCEGFPRRLGDRVSIVGAPALGDLDGDKKNEVALSLSDGRVMVVKSDGMSLPGLAFQDPTGMVAGCSLLEVEPGRLELFVGTKEGKVYAFRASGQERAGFPLPLGGSVTSPIAAALFGAAAKPALAVGNEDGKVYLVGLDGKPAKGFPAVSAYMVSGEPALGDLDGDGYNDVVFASQDFKLYAVKPDGTLFPGFPAALGARALGGAALGDVDGDGKLEIAVATIDGKLHVFTTAGQELKGFPVKLGEKLVGSALIADLDRDGKEEVLATTADGQIHAVRANGKPFPGFPARTGAEAISGPAVVESGDGTLVVQAAADRVFAYRVKRAGKATAALAWPEAGHDAARSGRVHPNAPGYADLKISPAAPDTDEVLTAAYRFYDLDGRPEPATEIRWFKDGKEVPELLGKRSVPKEATKKHEKWRFQLASPGAATRQSPEVSIVNSKPGHPKIAFEPAVVRRAEALKVKIVEDAPDADGDKLKYSYLWLRDGSPQRGLSKVELPAGTLKKGERWSVVVTASDGEAEGAPVNIEATVADSAPTAPEIVLSPAQPKAGDAVKVVIQKPAADVDGDPLKYRYRYYVDGVLLSLASTLDTLPPLSARKKQAILVEVQADDGELLGPVAKAQAAIVNTAPTAPKPSMVPREAHRGDTLVAGLLAAAQDIDGDRLSYRFSFAKEAKKVGDEQRVTGVKKGETYELTAIASDGEADSQPGKVTLTVKNTPPTAPTIGFESLPLRRSDPVKVKILEPSTDADGDAITYRWAWFRNGEPQTSLKSAEIAALTVKKGERWKVTVTPFDGEAEGTPSSLEATVVDSAPGAPEVVLSPAEPKIGDAVKAVTKREAADVDGDKLTYRYRFLVDGVAAALPESADTLPARTARKKQTIVVEVRADDGVLQGPLASAKAVVANTPPEAPKALVMPQEPRTTDALYGALAAPATDADGDTLTYRFSFTKDGKKVEAGSDGREVHGLKKGETYELQIVANDGEADSPPAVARVTVKNTPPTAPAVAFSNAAPQAGEAVDVKIERPSTDADADPIGYAYSFTVNGKSAGLPKEARAISAGRVKKHEEWAVEVTPSDGRENGPSAKARLVVVNTVPTAPSVVIEPAEPAADSGAKVRLVAAATDRDGDAIVYRYAWTRDGMRIDLPADASSLAPGTIKRGEVLKVTVTPFDGEAEGASATASAKVKNSAPSAPQIALMPAQPTVKDELVCAIKLASKDPDKETPTLRFTWRRDAEIVPVSADQDRIGAGVARHGETWSCEVVATDGALSSAPVVVQAKILNSPPGAAKLVVEPEAPRAGQDLLCRLVAPAEDPDGDPVTYAFRWTDGTKPLASVAKEPWRLPASATRKGQAYRCEVTASDGQASGPAAIAEGKYKNSPPTAPTLRLNPPNPVAGSAFTCEIVQPAVDPDGDAVKYRFAWQKNGVEQSFAPGSAEVPARLTKPGDIWRCQVTATDGESDGPTAFSPEALVEPLSPSAGR